jgi:K+-transporting ATPase c subunit
MWKEMKPAILITFVLTILTGILYPLAVTGLAQTIFHKQADGSLYRPEFYEAGVFSSAAFAELL